MEGTKHLEEELARCEEMLQNNPALASGHCDKGLLLFELKRYEEALEPLSLCCLKHFASEKDREQHSSLICGTMIKQVVRNISCCLLPFSPHDE